MEDSFIFFKIFLILLFLLLIYQIFLGPLYLIWSLQKKYGQKIGIYYYPLLGVLHARLKFLKSHQDTSFSSAYYLKEKNDQCQIYVYVGLKSFPVYMCVDPQITKQLLQNPDNFEKNRQVNIKPEWFQSGLFFSEGASWKRQRQIFTKAFHFQALKNYLPEINRITKECIKNDIKIGQVNKVVEHCCNITGKVVTSSFFDSKFHEKKCENIEIIPYLIQTTSMYGKHSWSLEYNLKSLLFKDYLNKQYIISQKEQNIIKRIQNIINLIKQEIKLEIQNKKENQIQKNNFLNHLLEAYQQGQMSITEIIDNFILLFFAGTDTTGTFTGMCLYSLAKYQNVQKILYYDILKYFQTTRKNFNPQEDFDVLYEDLNNITSLNNFIKECFRFYTPAPGIIPRKARKDMKLGDFKIKKGQKLFVSLHALYYCDKYYSNAEKFDIDRWNRDETKNMDPFNFMPFSSGPKNCVGQHLAIIEMKIMLIHHIMKHTFILNPQVQLVMETKFVRQPVDDRLVIIEKRKQQ